MLQKVLLALVSGAACGLIFGVVWHLYLPPSVGDRWILIPLLTPATCIMDTAHEDALARLVVVSTTRPGHCHIARAGGHPARFLLGTMRDTRAVAGEPAHILAAQPLDAAGVP